MEIGERFLLRYIQLDNSSLIGLIYISPTMRVLATHLYEVFIQSHTECTQLYMYSTLSCLIWCHSDSIKSLLIYTLHNLQIHQFYLNTLLMGGVKVSENCLPLSHVVAHSFLIQGDTKYSIKKNSFVIGIGM